MIGTKVYFKDLYGGIMDVHIKNNANVGDIYDLLDDFMMVSSDSIADDSAIIVARKFSVFADRAGYNTSINSREDAFNQLSLDLVSGNISPIADSGVMLELPEESQEGEQKVNAVSEIVNNELEERVPITQNELDWNSISNDIISYDATMTETVNSLMEVVMSPVETEETKNAKIKLMELYANVVERNIAEEPINIPVGSEQINQKTNGGTLERLIGIPIRR